jgi:tRNA dimethylallyltransferase
VATSPGDKRPAAISVARSIGISFSGQRVVVIAGPTAAGKSAVALDLALRAGGTIINADASQLYAGLRIVTARPSPADEARVPHRLYGILSPADTSDAARWAGLARDAIAATLAEGRLPIVTGGSGLYLRALLDGIADVPPVDPAIRAAVRALDPAAARAALAAEDPGATVTDPQRVARALEVVRATGQPLRDWQAAAAGGLDADVHGFVVDRPRAALHARIETRLAAMIAEGALDEVAALAARGLDPRLPVMKALGVAPLTAAARGEIPLDAAIAATAAATRQYAKRQSTWFRNQTPGWIRENEYIVN